MSVYRDTHFSFCLGLQYGLSRTVREFFSISLSFSALGLLLMLCQECLYAFATLFHSISLLLVIYCLVLIRLVGVKGKSPSLLGLSPK